MAAAGAVFKVVWKAAAAVRGKSSVAPQFGGGSIADLVISLWTSSDDDENDDRSPAKEVPLFRDEKLGEPRNLFS
jgi:hypothetical protein